MVQWEHYRYSCFVGQDKKAMQEAAQELYGYFQSLSPQQLLRFREDFSRTTSLEWSVDWTQVIPPIHKGIDDESLFAVLAAGTFHSNGYYREHCLLALEAYGGRALPFALLLVNNWVEAIRDKAFGISKRLYGQATVRQVLDSLWFLEYIRQGRRRSYQTWQQLYHAAKLRIVQMMETLSPGDILKENVFTRRLYYKMLAEGGTLDDGMALALLKRERDVFNKIKLAGYLLELQPISDGVMAALLKNKVGAIRLAALHRKEKQAKGLWPDAEAFLFDPNRSVREFTVYLFHKYKGADPVMLYRLRIAVDPQPGVIAGLGENGSQEDAALVMPFLKSEQPAVLKAAITAIASLLNRDATNILYRFVQHPHGGKTAFRLMLKMKMRVPCRRLYRDYFSSDSEILHQRIFRLICIGANWDKAPWLIRLYNSLPPELLPVAWDQLLYWQVGYMKPTYSERKAVEDALQDTVSLPKKLRQSIEFSLKTASY